MTDYTKLVEALRERARRENEWYEHGGDIIKAAAAAIEALLKENKELIKDHPEIVEADGHWEWRKPNGEVLLPKRGKWIRIDKHTIQCPLCHRYLDLRGVNAGRGDANYCPNCGAKMTEVQDDKR